ncbi:MAG: hypothetical protein R6U22_13050, partial [Desulfohalobiaceae bacterium]
MIEFRLFTCFVNPKLIAGHSNHNSFNKEEMLEQARNLKKLGAIIDICSGDAFSARQLFSSMEDTFTMIEEG